MNYFRKLFRNIKYLLSLNVSFLIIGILSLLLSLFVLIVIVLSPVLVLFKDNLVEIKIEKEIR